MSDRKVAMVYSQAIYDIAKQKDQIFPVLEMLEILVQHIKDDEEFKKFLEYPIIDATIKKEILNVIYQDIKDIPIEVLDYLIDKKRLANISEIKDEYLKIYNENHNRLIVTAIFAKELTEEQKTRLIRKLEKIKNKKILLHVVVDKSIIAGGILKIGDEVIDGSIRTQIKEFKNRF
ncbi:ATP synthase F1 subunit delta [Sneathia sanguinegens]|uniref:ATP synthase subunit delta n=1 Tax=Sneathia sanguinegens TaxID=40543 RepID=A0ABT7HLN0_9FUSO|nr:ATP synthase F1 subunit delta [Sneathia sanguinegens]MDK9581007.1 ATP synthase F1 subunit delta [Sneathia sanguinegens]MDU4652774.1 ATP synthase F1 subunit delta [Sneathia sanguinegens]MDU7497385.1 ATP synthase F1 subunit delta [Sneathia sanguinegens]